jgi:hypothetical protein
MCHQQLWRLRDETLLGICQFPDDHEGPHEVGKHRWTLDEVSGTSSYRTISTRDAHMPSALRYRPQTLVAPAVEIRIPYP